MGWYIAKPISGYQAIDVVHYIRFHQYPQGMPVLVVKKISCYSTQTEASHDFYPYKMVGFISYAHDKIPTVQTRRDSRRALNDAINGL